MNGDKAICSKNHGISLLSVAGKKVEPAMLGHLLTFVVDTLVPESQCGFLRTRRTVDMIFVCRILQEKCRKQYRDLFCFHGFYKGMRHRQS